MSEHVLRLFSWWRWLVWFALGVKISNTKVYIPPKSLRLITKKEFDSTAAAQQWICGQFINGPRPDVIVIRPAGEGATGEEDVCRCPSLEQAYAVIQCTLRFKGDVSRWKKLIKDNDSRWHRILIEVYTDPNKKKK